MQEPSSGEPLDVVAHMKDMDIFLSSIRGKEEHDFIPWLRAQLKCAQTAYDFHLQLGVFEKLGPDAAVRLARDPNLSNLHGLFVAVRLLKASIDVASTLSTGCKIGNLTAVTLVPLAESLLLNSVFRDAVALHFQEFVNDLVHKTSFLNKLMKDGHVTGSHWRAGMPDDATVQSLHKRFDEKMGKVPMAQVDARLKEVDQASRMHAYPAPLHPPSRSPVQIAWVA